MSNRFRSPLAEDLERFLAFKRALGHPYLQGKFTLRSFDRFVHEEADSRRPLAFEELVPR